MSEMKSIWVIREIKNTTIIFNKVLIWVIFHFGAVEFTRSLSQRLLILTLPKF